MSHFSQLKAMLDAISCNYVIDGDILKIYKSSKYHTERCPGIEHCIIVKNTGDNDFGHTGFESIWIFDQNGNLFGTGAYE